ncbi:arylsulfatase B-like isoform X2 [Pocillopora damicornis]|uniref:arylsulfatase B-like isoform X2 n=1 Tax=Pocillopora damicornis TaxID=46731 RepID=UPI000F55815C|nr:arylsulfatase B-like isoform X2 [Pocillopora damicornis]XP_027058116.1 arylsulfatase B-like isoform X2 [Pocillopora damicornis]
MRILWFLSKLVLLSSVTLAIKQNSKPNIIFILADDLGWDDVSFHGSEQIPTPNLDGLASSGVILNNYYVQSICTPTRSAIMTGRYPIHTGMQHDVILASQPYGLGLNETLLPQYLKELGYATHAVGKWHLGFFKTDYTPTRRGFDTFFGYYCGKEDYWDHSNRETNGWGLDLHNNTEHTFQPVWTEWGQYSTDMFTERAIDIIKKHDPSKPLFLYLPYQAVHSANYIQPIQAPPDEIKKFSHIKDENRRIFAAVVSILDQRVGQLVDALKGSGLYNNSVIVFSTDNGGPANGYDMNMACNFPLRGVKWTLWEGGVRGAGFVHSPLLAQKGRVSMDLMHVTDWLPTLYSVAGGDIHKLRNVDGYDMWDTLSQASLCPREEILLNIDPVRGDSALRFRQWKLLVNISTDWSGWYAPPGIEYSNHSTRAAHASLKNAVVTCGEPPSSPPECTSELGPCLFDVLADPCEYVNQAKNHPDVVDGMLLWLKEYRETMVPPRNKPFDPNANPNNFGGVWSPWMD